MCASERLACPEIMFRPLQPGVVGLHTATDAAIKACDVSMQQRMYGNIVFIGTQRERIRGIVCTSDFALIL